MSLLQAHLDRARAKASGVADELWNDGLNSPYFPASGDSNVIAAEQFAAMNETMKQIFFALVCLPANHPSAGDMPTAACDIFLTPKHCIWVKLSFAQMQYFIDHPPAGCTSEVVHTMCLRYLRLAEWYTGEKVYPEASAGEDDVAHNQYCAALLASADPAGVAATITFMAFAPSEHMFDNPAGLWYIFGVEGKGKTIAHGFLEKAETMMKEGTLLVSSTMAPAIVAKLRELGLPWQYDVLLFDDGVETEGALEATTVDDLKALGFKPGDARALKTAFDVPAADNSVLPPPKRQRVSPCVDAFQNAARRNADGVKCYPIEMKASNAAKMQRVLAAFAKDTDTPVLECRNQEDYVGLYEVISRLFDKVSVTQLAYTVHLVERLSDGFDDIRQRDNALEVLQYCGVAYTSETTDRFRKLDSMVTDMIAAYNKDGTSAVHTASLNKECGSVIKSIM